MSAGGARRAPIAWLTALVLAASLAACGGGGGPDGDAAEQVALARSYATAVSAATRQSGTDLAAISGRADYRDAGSAARSTGEYATAVRAAATALGRAKPPSAVVGPHRALVALYRSTADRMDALATAFAGVDGGPALTAKARELSAEVQRYSTRELLLRGEIDRALAKIVSPGTSPGTSPAGGAADGDDG